MEQVSYRATFLCNLQEGTLRNKSLFIGEYKTHCLSVLCYFSGLCRNEVYNYYFILVVNKHVKFSWNREISFEILD